MWQIAVRAVHLTRHTDIFVALSGARSLRVPFYPRSRPDKLFRCVPTTRTLYVGAHGTGCTMVADTSPYLECTEELSFDMFEPVSLTVE